MYGSSPCWMGWLRRLDCTVMHFVLDAHDDTPHCQRPISHHILCAMRLFSRWKPLRNPIVRPCISNNDMSKTDPSVGRRSQTDQSQAQHSQPTPGLGRSCSRRESDRTLLPGGRQRWFPHQLKTLAEENHTHMLLACKKVTVTLLLARALAVTCCPQP